MGNRASKSVLRGHACWGIAVVLMGAATLACGEHGGAEFAAPIVQASSGSGCGVISPCPPPAGLSGVTDIAVGTRVSYAATGAGQVYRWGSWLGGSSRKPVLVPGLS